MPKTSPDELWSLLVRTGLVDAAAAAALRAEHDARPGCGAADAKGVAAWLVERGTITRWQAKRLAIGDAGPFIIGDYRLLERHDHEGDALRFSALHQPSGRPVCVVLLHGRRCRDAAHWQEIVRAVGSAAAVTDPRVSRTWALELVGTSRLVVCEDVRGTPLADELAGSGPMPVPEAGALALEIATALAALHAAGTVHGALSLDTLVREQPAAGDGLRLLQFPLAGDPHQLPPPVPVATAEEVARLGRRASFVAPELLVPGAVCDMRSDVYALGCVLHALVTGAAPTARDDAGAVALAASGPVPLGPPAFPAELGALVGYLTARDPAGRYPHAAEAAAAIATCFGLPVPRLAPPPAPVRTAPEPAAAWGGLLEPAASPGESLALSAPGLERGANAAVTTTASARIAALQAARRRSRMARTVGGLAVGAVAVAAGLVIVSQLADRDAPAPKPAAPTGAKPAVAVSGPQAAAPEAAPDPGQAAARPAPPDQAATPTAGVETASATGPARPAATIVDDPRLPWASPTSGAPPDLAYLPAGSQLFLAARLADIDGDAQGRLFLRSLGPAAAEAVAWLAAACGCGPGDIELVQAGWQAGETDEIEGGCMVRLVGTRTVPDDAAFRSRAWGATTPRDVAGEKIHVGATASYWLPKAEGGRVLVVAPQDRLVQVVTDAAAGTKDVPLPADLEQVRDMLDAARHVTLLGSPHYLLNRGRKVFVGPFASLPGPVESLLGEGVQAAALSVHFGASFYAELDVVATLDTPPAQLADEVAARVARLPDAVEAHCVAVDLHPYGRKLVMRLPGMLRALAGQTRAAAEGKGVVVNAYLPPAAGHNLALAAELALSQGPGGGAVAAPAAPAAAPPQDAIGKLGKKITLTFAKDDLERVIQMVSDEVGVPMEIMGPDLQLEGITKNQPLGLDERDKPAVEILTVILKKADPVGRLVYYVKKNKDGVEAIEISTRVAAEKRGEKLAPGQ